MDDFDPDYEPTNLKRWTHPEYYAGEIWPDYYSSGVGQSRDSSCLERSNFRCMLRALGGETETVIVVREDHWAVGWVEWIAIHSTDTKSLKVADEIAGALEGYPVVNEEDFSELEWNEAADYWDSMSPREKVQMFLYERERYHWLHNEPVWMVGRWDFSQLANADEYRPQISSIANAVYESLRNS